MKIALLTFDFSPDKAGGVGNVVNGMLSSLKNSGFHETEIIVSSFSRSDAYSRAFTSPKTWRNDLYAQHLIKNYVVHRVGTNGSEFEVLRYKKKKILSTILRDFDAVVIVTGSLQFCNVLPNVAIPVFVQCATRLAWERESQYKMMPYQKRLILRLQQPILSLIERKVIARNYTFIPENEAMNNWLKDEGVKSVHKWYPPILGINQIEMSEKSATKRFISVGRLNEPRKGWGRLFQAYENAYMQDSSIQGLDVVGLGSLSLEDQALLKNLRCRDSVRIHSNLSNDERDALLQNSSYFLQASFEEGLGLAALEALQAGIPLICSKTDGSSEYVENSRNGFIVEQDNSFLKNFSRLILESSTWDHQEMSKQSQLVFEEKFSQKTSERELVRILTTDYGVRH